MPATRFAVAWPADQRFETLTRIELNGAELSGAVSPFRVVLDLRRESPARPRGPTGEPRCDFGFLAPGAYELTLRLYSNHGDVATYRKRVSVPKQAQFDCCMTPADSR